MAEETYESEGPKCPHCGRQFTADEPHFYDEMNYISDECDECGKHFKVEVCVSVYWRCEELEQPARAALEGEQP